MKEVEEKKEPLKGEQQKQNIANQPKQPVKSDQQILDERNQKLTLHDKLSKEDLDWFNKECTRCFDTYLYQLNRRRSGDNAVKAMLIADYNIPPDKVMTAMSDMTGEQFKAYFQDFLNRYANPNKTPEENIRELGKMKARMYKNIGELSLPVFKEPITIEQVEKYQETFDAFKLFEIDMEQDYEYLDSKDRYPIQSNAYFEGTASSETYAQDKAKYMHYAQNMVNTLSELYNPEYSQQMKAEFLYTVKPFFTKYNGKKLKDVSPKEFTNGMTIFSALGAKRKPREKDDKGNFIRAKEDPEFDEYLQGKRPNISTEKSLDENQITFEAGLRDLSKDSILGKAGKFIKEGITGYDNLFTHEVLHTENVLTLSQDTKNEIIKAYYNTLRGINKGLVPMQLSPVVRDEFDLFRIPGGLTIRQYVEQHYAGKTPEEKRQAMVIESMRNVFDGGLEVDYFEIDKDYNFTRQMGVKIKAESELAKDETEFSDFQSRLDETQKDREELFLDGDGKAMTDVQKMSEEEIESAVRLYDEIVGPMVTRDAYQFYKGTHPSWSEFDQFKIGDRTLREAMGKEKYDQILAQENGKDLIKAEIIRLSADPAVPFSFTAIRYDQIKKKFSNTDPFEIISGAIKAKVLVEKPYLESMDTYKKWFAKESSINTKSFTKEDWQDLYRGELRSSANSGFIDSERIISQNDLRGKVDEDIKAEMGLQYVYSTFGSEPKFIQQFAGDANGEGAVYSADQFKQYLYPVDSGSFTNDEFALMAFLVSTTPEAMEGDVYPEVGKHLTNEEKVELKSGEWTNDLRNGDKNIGKYLGTAINPARKYTSELIEINDQGNSQELASAVAKGISKVLQSVKTARDLDKPDGIFAFNGHILKETFNLLDAHPDLAADVGVLLPDGDMEFAKATVKLVEMQDECFIAQNFIENNNYFRQAMDPDELQENVEKIATFEHFASRWNKSIEESLEATHKSKDYKNYEKKVKEASKIEGLTAEEQLAYKESYNLKMKMEESNNLNVDSELVEELNSENPTYGNAERAAGDIEAIRTILNEHVAKYNESRKVFDREQRWVYPEDITPEISAENRYIHANEDFYIHSILKKIAPRFSKESEKRLLDKYKMMAETKEGWKARTSLDDMTGGTSTNNKPEAIEYAVKIIMDELQLHPYGDPSLGDLREEIENIKSPLESNLEDIIEYPHEKEINELKAAEKSDVNKELLDRVNRNLARRTDGAYSVISSGLSTERPAVIVVAAGGSTVEKYHNGEFKNYSTEGFENKEIKGSDLNYAIEKKPELIQVLKDNPPKMTPEDKAKVCEMVRMIKAAGFVNKNAPIEQGTKVYVHEKLLDAKHALEDALQTGDMKKIRKANAAYEAEHQKMTQIFEKTEELFPNTKLAPGNVDTIRNGDVPPEFSTKLTTESIVNGFYQLANMCENLGVSPEEFIDNPGKHIIDYVQKSSKEKGFGVSNKIPGKSGFMASYRALYEKGIKYSNKESLDKDMNFLGPDLVVDRCINAYALRESDVEKRNDMERYQSILQNQVTNIIGREEAYVKVLFEIHDNMESVPADLKQELKNGLKHAFVECGNIEKYHLPMDYLGSNGEPLEKPDYNKALRAKNKYNKIIDNYKKTLSELAEINKINDANANDEEIKDVDTDFATAAVEESMFDYLMAHPEDAMKQEYKDLEKVAMGAHKQLGLSGKSNLVTQYKEWKHNFNKELGDLQKDARNKDLALNKNLKTMNEKLRKLTGLGDDNGEAMQEFLREQYRYNQAIENRIKELAEDYKANRVTENYFTNRIEHLLDLKSDLSTDVKEPPTFFDTNNPDAFERDAQIINNRVRVKSKKRLSSLESYKEWKLKQSDMKGKLEESDLTAEDWKMLYEAEMQAAGLKVNDLPEGYKELENGMVINEKDVREDINLSDYLGGKFTPKKRVSYEDRKQTLMDDLSNKPNSLASVAADKKRSKPEREAAEKEIMQHLAEAIAAKNFENNKGNLPGGVSEETFVRRMMNEESYSAMTSPLINTVVASVARVGQKVGAAKHKALVDTVVDMIEDNSIIKACDKDQKYLKDLENNPSLVNRASPGMDYTRKRMSKGVNDHLGIKTPKQVQRNNQPKNLKQSGNKPEGMTAG